MKVVFLAFGGKLRSGVIELPENTTDRFRLPMDMDVLRASPTMDGSSLPDTPISKVGTFQWTGRYLVYPDVHEHPREYILVDVS